MSDIKQNYLNGSWEPSDVVGDSYSPATGQIIGRYYEASESQVEDAINAAAETFEMSPWQHDRELRAAALNELADLIEAHSSELVELLAQENGKVLGEAGFELSLVPSKLRYYAAQALVDLGYGAQTKKGAFSTLLRQPIGVAGVIVPWNSPVVLSVRSFAPALAAGCTAVVKMPAQTALVNARLAEIVSKATKLPAGVLSFFTESGDEGSKLLVRSPKVPVISYTGSTKVGRQIMADAAPHLKRLSLELGGKTPMIVFDDADLDEAVGTIVAGITTFTGQFCMTGSRILAQQGIAQQLRQKLKSALAAVEVGPGDAPNSQMGPMIDRAARDGLVERIKEKSANAEVLLRGGPPEGNEDGSGAYYRPELYAVQDTDSALIQEELFGPIATFEVFENENDAIQRANVTEYGLAASVWTQNGQRGLRMADRIDAGTVWINGWAAVFDQFEEGGFKQSGLGRLNGNRALEEFQEVKHVVQFA